MRGALGLSATILALLSTAVVNSTELSPFFSPALGSPLLQSNHSAGAIELHQRDGSCPADYTQCGSSSACCRSGTRCQVDYAGQIACCPNGALCTGTISTGVSATTSGELSTGTAFTSATTTKSFVPATTTNAAGGGSTVPNPYYPYVYLPTTYYNPAACSTYYTSCQKQYSSCTASLNGVNGVTVTGQGGGVTVQGTTVTGAQATSICSSLSSQACYGLQVTNCKNYGTAGVGGQNAGYRHCVEMYGVGLGVAIGVAGQVLG
ncbi:hypothetical protein L228DRAFT_10190 [Xylona heveae TC161]|uniref:Uncharacterized protein n=1 Tax=Xylona heveae (strain CBS 132557 / TC161) TaxID=1328760 RepID=A0A165JJU4_XYLHT|nr:hypothetical protein L228DRAFT_10190 [Xylona heveae TC161]KZF26329.1 hypothetical protein L228DRAFT_10190 [Xylona heveae TC161]